MRLRIRKLLIRSYDFMLNMNVWVAAVLSHGEHPGHPFI